MNTIQSSEEHDVPILRLEGITKRYGTLEANKCISLSIRKGEVHVLFGENGAGKSTLSNIIYGYKRPDEGKIFINGNEVVLKSPHDATDHNIGMVHQHFMLVPTLSGIKNILLGLEYGSGPFLDYKRAQERIDELCERYQIKVDLQKEVWRLSVGEQQWVEILKALFLGSEILILDEPTASLTPQEVELLLDRVNEMKSEGITIILVSHKLKEIDKVADRITVLRRGKMIGTVNQGEVSNQELVKMMVGKECSFGVDKVHKEFGKPVLELEHVCSCVEGRKNALRDVEFKVREGEIFGIAGVSGNGQKELYEVITALHSCSEGEVRINGKKVYNRIGFVEWHNLKVAEIPEDRTKNGSIGTMSLEENLLFGKHREDRYQNNGVLDWKLISQMAKQYLEEFNVRPPAPKYPASSLSGGNLQKLILARELSTNPKLIIAAQPTRGLDVVAVQFIWDRLMEEREKGAACLLISEDLDELVVLSDRIGVLYNGELVEIFEGDFDFNEIGDRMINGRKVHANHEEIPFSI